MLEAKRLTVAYEGGDAVRDVSFSAEAGEWLMLIGPNGAGKSTLLAALAQCAPYQGTVLLDARDARRWRPRAFARAVGVLAQTHAAGYAFTVEELVSMGRYAHTHGFFRSQDPNGREAVRRALDMAGLWELRLRNMRTLSGGELQRAYLAQALAQEPRVLLLDRGCLTADGPARETLASDALRRAYGMDVADWMAQTAERWREVAGGKSHGSGQGSRAC